MSRAPTARAAHRWRAIPLLAAFAALCGAPSAAHVFSITDVLVLLKDDGSYQVDLTLDVDALALGVSPTTAAPEVVAALESLGAAEFEAAVEAARDTIRRRVRLRFDGVAERPAVGFPRLGGEIPGEPAVPTVLGTTARLVGRVPAGARELTFGASRALGPVRLTVLEQATAAGAHFTLGVAEDSPPFRIGATAPGGTDRASIVARYLVLGFEHILPRGVDHILFVLGLFLLGTRLAPLLWQVTAFTVAHTTTLALSMGGVLAAPSSVVEPLIALSISYVAIENLFTQDLKPWRPALVFGFGLLHGLGFAGVLRQLGLPSGEFVPALVAFNAGVELGQLTVILTAFVALGRLRHRPWYRPRVALPLSALIALVGLYWAIQRTL